MASAPFPGLKRVSPSFFEGGGDHLLRYSDGRGRLKNKRGRDRSVSQPVAGAARGLPAASSRRIRHADSNACKHEPAEAIQSSSYPSEGFCPALLKFSSKLDPIIHRTGPSGYRPLLPVFCGWVHTRITCSAGAVLLTEVYHCTVPVSSLTYVITPT